MQVFIRSAPQSVLRDEIARAVIERWHMFGSEVQLHWIRVPTSVVKLTEFHWYARKYAEVNATSDYLYGDDDILPIDANFVRYFIEDWEKCPSDVVMLGSVSTVWSERHPWMNDAMEIREGPVGGLVMVRKGVIPWGGFRGPANQDDGEIAAWIQSHGYRTMVSPRLVRNHVGFGLSELSPGWWLKC